MGGRTTTKRRWSTTQLLEHLVETKQQERTRRSLERREAFLNEHGDLFEVGFWRRMQERNQAGEIIEFFPYRDEIVPLRKRISEEVLLRYNGMLMSVFELLADSREQIAAVSAYIDALRGFWIAESDLQAALIEALGLPSSTGSLKSGRTM